MRTTAEGPRSILASEILRLVPCDRIAFAVPLPNGSGFRIAGVHPEDVIGVTTNAIAAQRVSAEGQEGLRAFLEKRKPGWSA